MATTHPLPAGARRAAQATGLGRYLPFTRWLLHYDRANLPSDLVAGIVTAIMLIPQSMAYAQLAGLPPQVGLYASVVPLIVYALLGSSGQLSVGPVAITSLLVFSGVGALAEPGSERYIQLVLLHHPPGDAGPRLCVGRLTDTVQLLALARNAGRALSREQLIDLVWGTDFYGTDRVVDV